MDSTVSGRYLDFMQGASESFVARGGGTSAITPEDIDVVGFAGPLNGGSRDTPSITPEDINVGGFAGGSIGGATKIISKDDRGIGGFANAGSMLPNPEIEMIGALGQIAARGQYGELLNAVKEMPANISGMTDAISKGDMRALGSNVADAVFAAAGAKAKTGMAQGALAAAKNFISPRAVEATAAAQARMPSMAMSLGAAPTANLSAADKAKAALEASKRSAAQPITLGAVASCGGASRGQPASALVGPIPVTPPVVAPAAAKAAESLLKKAGPATAGGVLVGGMLYSPSLGGDKEEITAPDGTVYTKYSDETLYTATAQNGETWTTPSPQDDVGYRTWLANGGDGSMQDWVTQGRPGEVISSENIPVNDPASANNVILDGKIRSQLEARGWTEEEIKETIKNGATGSTTDKRSAAKTLDQLSRNDPATVYGEKNGYIIVNDRTAEIVQISDRNDPNWIPDSRIVWK